MPAVPGSVIDGIGIGYGSFIATFTIAGAYIVENFTVNRPVQTARDRKTTGEPNRSRYTADFCSATGTLQAPAGAPGYPAFGDSFTAELDSNYGSEIWVIMPVPYTATNDPASLRKINVTFEKQNTTTLTKVTAAAAQP